jgi:FKBP-type peptidyl-prolyl cis-trans isomerase
MKLKQLFLLLAFALILTQQACSQIGGYSTSPTGLKYKFIKGSGKDVKPLVSDIVTVKMDYFINDSLLFSSSKMGKPMQFPLNPIAFKGDFFEGISIMSAGDSASFICPADSVFLRIFRVKQMPPFVVPGSTMRFEISLDSFMTKKDFEELKLAEATALQQGSDQRLKDYIKEKGITVEPLASGLYYIETQKGTGNLPKQGEKIRVHYRGTLLDGTPFDASYDRNQPFDFVLGMGQVIRGWDEGLSLMHEGGKATLILPYNLAYGERATGQIPPFSPLVFEVELIEIIK